MSRGERGQRHKPPRIDTKYQIAPTVLLTAEEYEKEAKELAAPNVCHGCNAYNCRR